MSTSNSKAKHILREKEVFPLALKLWSKMKRADVHWSASCISHQSVEFGIF
jgi:hypothetical protein